jgi:hypothetical protein
VQFSIGLLTISRSIALTAAILMYDPGKPECCQTIYQHDRNAGVKRLQSEKADKPVGFIAHEL